MLIAVGAINFAFGISFVLRGAWPIMPFMGADVLLLAWAFRASRRAAPRSEHVTLTPSELRIARRPRARQAQRDRAQSLLGAGRAGGRCRAGAQTVCFPAMAAAFQLGAFLAPQDRACLAEALKAALRAAREFRPV